MTGTAIPSLKQAQQRLEVWAKAEGKAAALPEYGADGLGGTETRNALLDFQRRHPPLAVTGQFDSHTVNLLFSAPPSAGHTLAKNIGLGILTLAINQALKGLGINMDFSKVSKALAGGLTSAGLLGGSSVYGYINLPPDALAILPHWVVVTVPIVNAVVGFAVGFSVVYFAPPNKG